VSGFYRWASFCSGAWLTEPPPLQWRWTLTEEGIALFLRPAAGRGGDEFLLGKGQQNRPLADACKRAGIVPAINFHALRHTYASLSLMVGAPLLVVARALGHATTRMTEMHYAHPSFEASEIRRTAPRFGIAPDPVSVCCANAGGDYP
jgi:integrase